MNTTIVIAVMSALIVIVAFVLSYLEGRRDWIRINNALDAGTTWMTLQEERVEALEELVMELHSEEMKKKDQGRTMHQ